MPGAARRKQGNEKQILFRELGFLCLSTLQRSESKSKSLKPPLAAVRLSDYCMFSVCLKAEHLVHTPLITWQV